MLDFFADHPGQPFTLTEVIRALRLSRATCHALLTGLAEAGYLFRGSDKNYVLGPRLAAIGRLADAHFSPLQIAQPEMRRLADHFDVVCSAVFLEGTDVVVRERASSVSHLGDSIPRGSRLPLRVPFAAVFIGWLSESQRASWLGLIDPPPPAEALAELERGIAFVRDNGFQIILNFQRRPSGEDRGWPVFDGPSEQPLRIETAPERETSYPIAAVSAPVFKAPGTVAFTLTLAGFGRIVRGDQLLEAAHDLRAACDRIGAFLASNP